MCVVTHLAHMHIKKKRKKKTKTSVLPPTERSWRVTFWSIISVIPVLAVHQVISFSPIMRGRVIICRSTVKDCTTFWLIYYLVHFSQQFVSQSYISMLCYIWSASILLNKMWWRLSKVTVGLYSFFSPHQYVFCFANRSQCGHDYVLCSAMHYGEYNHH